MKFKEAMAQINEKLRSQKTELDSFTALRNGDSSKIDMNNKKTESSLQMMRQDVKLAKTSVESLKMNFERFVERFDKLEVNT